MQGRMFLAALFIGTLFFGGTAAAQDKSPKGVEPTKAAPKKAKPSAAAENPPEEKDLLQKGKEGLLEIKEDVQEKAKEVTKEMRDSRYNRGQSTAYGVLTYSPLDLILPSKIGATIGFFKSSNQTWELEYVRTKLSTGPLIADLGHMVDQRISLLGRSYMGTNSFYMGYGLSYMDFTTKLGSEYLTNASNGSIPEIDLVTTRSVGFQLSIGNAWVLENGLVFGVDWVGWYQPVFKTKRSAAFVDNSNNASQAEDVDDALDLLAYFPRLTFFKLQVGYSF